MNGHLNPPGAAGLPACGVCAAPAPAPFRPPPAETAPDLDLRPGEPTRSTLPRWVACCRRCGACAPDLTRLTPEGRPVIESESYRRLDGPTAAFRRWAMLCTTDAERAEATMQAAWAADDAGDEATATACREAAASLWEGERDPQIGLRRLDALRRAGAFEAARSLVDRLEGDADILAFQRARIAAQDRGRYLLSSALRPPARTPHAGHGKRAIGFWKSLFG